MSRSYKPILILCEDRQQDVAIRHFLKQYYGIGEHAFQVKFASSGSGKQFVQSNYTEWVRLYRQKAHHLNIALVVVIDADENTIAECYQNFEDRLKQHNLPPRSNQDRIAIFIPRRNIETWIYFLQGKDVDEDTVYPHLKHASDCKKEVVLLAQNCKNGITLPENAPPSLKEACEELKRIPRFDD